MTDNTKKTSVSIEETRAIADLALIEVDDEDLAELREALEVVLEHFSVIEKVELEDGGLGSPVERPCRHDELRDDIGLPPRAEEAVRAAPDFEDNLFFVPRVVE
jgi:aspartyl/glutamyl-tRNA(Asn/Gln) amidotransferase C subunit